VSIAEIDTDSEFSRFPGVDRSLLVIDGAGMVVDVEGRGSFRLDAQGPPLSFSGDVATTCRLIAGPTRDFNVMTRRGVVSHVLRRHTLAGSLVLEQASLWLVHVLDGHAMLDEVGCTPGDSALVDARRSVTLTGVATLLLVELHRD
jgi:environmental stress-induced protein Ves